MAAGQNRNVLQHGLPTIPESGRLHRGDIQGATELVHHQGGERLAFHLLGDDHERLAHLSHLLQEGQQVLHAADFLFVDQQHGFFNGGFHPLGIGDEVRGDIPPVELHALDDIQRGGHGFRFLDRNDAVLADLFHRFGNQVADRRVVVGGNGADLGDFFLRLAGSAELLEFFNHQLDGPIDPSFDLHRVAAGRNVLRALAVDRLRKNCRGSRPVAGHIAGLAGHFAD